MVTVSIVFSRTTAVVLHLIEVDRHTHLHTEAEHFRNLLALVCHHLLRNLHCTFIINSISQ